MKYYIGLGGIGCRAVCAYAKTHDIPADRCFYIDSDASIVDMLPDANVYLVSGLSQGTACCRNIGRSAILQEIFRGNLRGFFRNIFTSQDVSLHIMTSSFGGFGGGVAAAVMDYLQANIWQKRNTPCSVYAVTESVFRGLGFPRKLMDRFESNTIDFVRDFSDRIITAKTPFLSERFSDFSFSQCKLWLLDGCQFAGGTDFGGADRFAQALDMDDEQLEKFDLQKRYQVKPISAEQEVFISYSSKDQDVADRILHAVESKGIRCWIASRDMHEGSYPRQIMQQIRACKVFLILLSVHSVKSEHVKNELDRAFSRLKEGMIMVPFLLDNVDLDDECMYYLCRQELFSGNRPPLETRIEELSGLVESIVRNP